MLLKNPRDEKFAQLVAGGMKYSAAFKVVCPRAAKWKNPKKVRDRASEIAARCRPRIEELQTVSASGLVASRQELAEYLTSIIRTPIGDVTPKSALAQEHTKRSFGEDGEVETLKVPSKLEAVAQLCKLMGYNEPDKTQDTRRFEIDLLVQRRFAEVADGG